MKNKSYLNTCHFLRVKKISTIVFSGMKAEFISIYHLSDYRVTEKMSNIFSLSRISMMSIKRNELAYRVEILKPSLNTRI
jgi:hypothetical protein